MNISKLKKDITILIIINISIGAIEFVFDIFCTNFFGPEGMGLISLVGPVICLFMSFLTEGFVVTISKMVGEKYFANKKNDCLHIFYSSLKLSLSLGLILSISLYFISPVIAANFLNDASLCWPLRASCPLLLLMSLSNVYKGYFLGINKIRLPGLINITEKLCRYPILFLLIYFFLNGGSYPPITLMYLCFSIGELVSVSLLTIYFKYNKLFADNDRVMEKNDFSIWKVLLSRAIPICATNILMDFTASLTSIIVKSQLIDCGFSYGTALSLIGKLKGMAMPIMIFYTGALAPFLYTSAALTSILIGLGKEKIAFLNSTLQQTCLCSLLYLFTGYKTLNIMGYIPALGLALVLNIGLNFRVLSRYRKNNPL